MNDIKKEPASEAPDTSSALFTSPIISDFGDDVNFITEAEKFFSDIADPAEYEDMEQDIPPMNRAESALGRLEMLREFLETTVWGLVDELEIASVYGDNERGTSEIRFNMNGAEFFLEMRLI